MSWKCFLIKSIRQTEWKEIEGGGRERHTVWTLPDGREVEFRDIPVGAMWHTDLYPEDHYAKAKNSLAVVLPGKRIWYMAEPPTNGGSNWTITGTPPVVTAVPSINFVGTYHGFVQNGVVTDDVDGRKFNEDGTPG